MGRISLTDGSGKWFDGKSAEKFNEDENWNGRNFVSVATGDQFNHEKLYRTKKGMWVKYCWSDWQGSDFSIEEISENEAATWLSKNNYDLSKIKGLEQYEESLEV